MGKERKPWKEDVEAETLRCFASLTTTEFIFSKTLEYKRWGKVQGKKEGFSFLFSQEEE